MDINGIPHKGRPTRFAIASAFASQLGNRWSDLDSANPNVQAIIILAAMHALRFKNASRKRKRVGMKMINPARRGKTVSKLLDKYANDACIQRFINTIGSRHGFENTVAAAAIETARIKAGPLPSSEFLWLRRVDRSLWYTVNNLGRHDCHIEGLGSICHYNQEKTAKASLSAPCVDEAVDGLIGFIETHDFEAMTLLSQAGEVRPGNHSKEVFQAPVPVRKSSDDHPFLLGCEIGSNETVRFSNADCRKHFFAFGDTGSGRTETMVGFTVNALSSGSGYLLCDGKGDLSLFARAYEIARRFGREDDLLVLNFMTGSPEGGAPTMSIRSNTFNPFARGSADALKSILLDVMGNFGCDTALWKLRATKMLSGIMQALVWLRDTHALQLTPSVIVNHLNLTAVIDFADSSKYPDMPGRIRDSLNAYLTSLPGYDAAAIHDQSQVSKDQHGFLELQFTRILTPLYEAYGHVFETMHGEIDLQDVFLNRRLLVVLLPALEKSGEEISDLGKIVFASFKAMMNDHLAFGGVPTNYPDPFFAIMDEISYYMIDGMAMMASKARALGISLTFTSKYPESIGRLDKVAFNLILENTATKLFMKSESMSGVREMVASEIERYRPNHEMKAGSHSLEMIEAHLVSALDFREQAPGDMYVVREGEIMRVKSLYAGLGSLTSRRSICPRANHFVGIPPHVSTLPEPMGKHR